MFLFSETLVVIIDHAIRQYAVFIENTHISNESVASAVFLVIPVVYL